MTEMSVREALCQAMSEEMRLNESVFLMGEEVGEYQGAYKVSEGMLEEFGNKRVIDTPITEAGFTGVAIGAAMKGLRPIVEFMTWNFSMQAMDQIVNSAAKTRYMSGGSIEIPIVFRGPNGAASRVAAQHSQDFSSWFSHIPGLIVVAPYDSNDAKGLLKEAIKNPNPVIFLEHELMYGRTFKISNEHINCPIDAARIMSNGKDVTLVSYSKGVDLALKASKILINEFNVNPEVINLRTLRPIDMNSILSSVKKTHRIVCIEEGWPICSIGSEISAKVTEDVFDYLDTPPIKVSGKDTPMPYAENLEKIALPSISMIVNACLQACYVNKKYEDLNE
tara:strand:+ start:515 stop:1522 length:1008 start_codon:yes stop_codon:yes gene_type:complete